MSTNKKAKAGLEAIEEAKRAATITIEVPDDLIPMTVDLDTLEPETLGEIAPATEAKAPEVKKVDIQPLIKVIPDTFTPALLDKLFNLNDGGKTVRRHLRKNFTEAVEHAKKEKWGFTKANVDILQYFADRYAYDLKVLEPATKTA